MWCILCSSRVGLHVREVRTERIINVTKVKAHPESVPRGIDLPGFFSSPDRLAPAIIPI